MVTCMPDLSKKQSLFVENYLATGNAAEAARRAGYCPSAARQAGYRLLRNPAVDQALATKQAEAAYRFNLSRDELVRQLLAAHRKAASATEEINAIREIGKMLGLYVR